MKSLRVFIAAFVATLFVFLLSSTSAAQQNQILDVFPKASFAGPQTNSGETRIFDDFSPSGSVWDSRLEEEQVFQFEMEHRQGAANSFKLRMGKGGQLYSLRGPFGESVPPSWRAEGADVSPFNDEVWQFVAVCSKYNGIAALRKAGDLPESFAQTLKQCGFADTYFVHSSGAYIPGSSKLKSLYCPLLASRVDEENRSIQMLNWGLVPQIRTIHRSPLLYYTQVRDAGDGVIELTWVVHNFSQQADIVFDHLNAPWGGTRITSLPLRYISTPDGKLRERKGFLDPQHHVVDVRKTGGWNLSCQSDEEDSPSLALVFGQDRHLEREQKLRAAGKPHAQVMFSFYRDWRAGEPLYKTNWKDWRTRPENSFRNYDVVEFIPKLKIEPERTIWFRSFLVVGPKNEVMKQATALVDHVDYGLLHFKPQQTPLKRVSLEGKRFHVYSRPVSGSVPLFAIENTESGERVISTDPYFFVKKTVLGLQLPEAHPHHDYYATAMGYSMDQNRSEWKSLVGFALQAKPDDGSWLKLSDVLSPALFPEQNGFHRGVWVKSDRTSQR